MPPANVGNEELLASDGVTYVVRIGGTVRRPVRPFTATVQAHLAHLHNRGFTAAPKPLGYDEQGQEVLSFVAGEVPVDPLPDWAVTPEVLVALAQLVRRLHDAAQGWTPPAGAVWGSIPGRQPPGGGAVVRGTRADLPSGLRPGQRRLPRWAASCVDRFDLARPTTRVADAVNALHWWVPLLDPCDRPRTHADADAAARMRLFADAYGMDATHRAEVTSVAVRRAANATLRCALPRR
jgi:hypothetical protein